MLSDLSSRRGLVGKREDNSLTVKDEKCTKNARKIRENAVLRIMPLNELLSYRKRIEKRKQKI
jgi:hypothetical protein